LRVKRVGVLASRTSTAARRSAAVAPDSHCAFTAPRSGELSRTAFSLKSRSIFSRFGITVSTLSVLAKLAPPTVASAFQSPVGASGAVLSSKA
jgi:hypothetical protein